ncbi:hypothetical protein BKA81DRAFT_361928 [Phyllosticta paracitricarpa]
MPQPLAPDAPFSMHPRSARVCPRHRVFGHHSSVGHVRSPGSTLDVLTRCHNQARSRAPGTRGDAPGDVNMHKPARRPLVLWLRQPQPVSDLGLSTSSIGLGRHIAIADFIPVRLTRLSGSTSNPISLSKPHVCRYRLRGSNTPPYSIGNGIVTFSCIRQPRK